MENLEIMKNTMSEKDAEDLTFERILEDYFDICITKLGEHAILVEITGKNDDKDDDEVTVYAVLNKEDSDKVLAMKHTYVNIKR